MGTPFLGEIKITSFNFAPSGWALCNGQLLPINQNQALFSLLGTMYGGNGQTNFALPDFRGRMPVHVGTEVQQGQAGGAWTHTLTQAELPPHSHALNASNALAGSGTPGGALLGRKGRLGRDIFGPMENLTTLGPASVSNTGGSQPHDNTQPFLALNFMIALSGVFPSRN